MPATNPNAYKTTRSNSTGTRKKVKKGTLRKSQTTAGKLDLKARLKARKNKLG